MKSMTCRTLLALCWTTLSHARLDTKCVRPGVRDAFRNECAEFVLTVGSDTYGVRLPITASQGGATLGTMYDDKRRRDAPTSVPVDLLSTSSEAVVVTDYPAPTPAEDRQWPTSDAAAATATSQLEGSSISVSTSTRISSYANINDQMGPGINNVPIKAIKGEGQNGGKVTYPNKHGSPQCKKAKKCITISKTGPIRPCIAEIKEKIHDLATNYPEFTFEPLKPIVCAPALDSNYCAFVELVGWQPSDEKNARLVKKMNVHPYVNMEYNKVPVGAITEGIDWIVEGKAKLCGESLLPVPSPEDMGHPAEKGKVYVLKLDVNPTLPAMDPEVKEAHERLAGVSGW